MKTLRRALAFGLTLSMAALASACGGATNSPAGDPDAGGTEGGHASADAGAKGETGGGSTAPTFTQIYTNVVVPNGCTVCHNPSTDSGSLDMSTQAAAYTNLVGVTAAGPSCGGMGLIRVVKGDASMSLMYEKVSEADPPCGSQMPLNGAPISSADMTMVMDWINAGAMNN
jgi:hypothetical protein